MKGEKIENLFTRNMKQPYVLQKLTDRSYYFQRFFYSTTFYVGDKGVLLFDALEGRGQHILQAIREVTLLPVTTIVYRTSTSITSVTPGSGWTKRRRQE